MREWLTLKEAAERLGLSKEGIRKRISRGQMEGYLDDNGRWMVQVGDDENANSDTDDVRADSIANSELAPYQPDIQPSNALVALQLQAIYEVVERQQEKMERIDREIVVLLTQLEAQGQRDQEREQAAEERAERLERGLADVRRAMEAREQAASKPRGWKFWRR